MAYENLSNRTIRHESSNSYCIRSYYTLPEPIKIPSLKYYFIEKTSNDYMNELEATPSCLIRNKDFGTGISNILVIEDKNVCLYQPFDPGTFGIGCIVIKSGNKIYLHVEEDMSNTEFINKRILSLFPMALQLWLTTRVIIGSLQAYQLSFAPIFDNETKKMLFLSIYHKEVLYGITAVINALKKLDITDQEQQNITHLKTTTKITTTLLHKDQSTITNLRKELEQIKKTDPSKHSEIEKVIMNSYDVDSLIKDILILEEIFTLEVNDITRTLPSQCSLYTIYRLCDESIKKYEDIISQKYTTVSSPEIQNRISDHVQNVREQSNCKKILDTINHILEMKSKEIDINRKFFSLSQDQSLLSNSPLAQLKIKNAIAKYESETNPDKQFHFLRNDSLFDKTYDFLNDISKLSQTLSAAKRKIELQFQHMKTRTQFITADIEVILEPPACLLTQFTDIIYNYHRLKDSLANFIAKYKNPYSPLKEVFKETAETLSFDIWNLNPSSLEILIDDMIPFCTENFQNDYFFLNEMYKLRPNLVYRKNIQRVTIPQIPIPERPNILTDLRSDIGCLGIKHYQAPIWDDQSYQNYKQTIVKALYAQGNTHQVLLYNNELPVAGRFAFFHISLFDDWKTVKDVYNGTIITSSAIWSILQSTIKKLTDALTKQQQIYKEIQDLDEQVLLIKLTIHEAFTDNDPQKLLNIKEIPWDSLFYCIKHFPLTINSMFRVKIQLPTFMIFKELIQQLPISIKDPNPSDTDIKLNELIDQLLNNIQQKKQKKLFDTLTTILDNYQCTVRYPRPKITYTTKYEGILLGDHFFRFSTFQIPSIFQSKLKVEPLFTTFVIGLLSIAKDRAEIKNELTRQKENPGTSYWALCAPNLEQQTINDMEEYLFNLIASNFPLYMLLNLNKDQYTLEINNGEHTTQTKDIFDCKYVIENYVSMLIHSYWPLHTIIANLPRINTSANITFGYLTQQIQGISYNMQFKSIPPIQNKDLKQLWARVRTIVGLAPKKINLPCSISLCNIYQDGFWHKIKSFQAIPTFEPSLYQDKKFYKYNPYNFTPFLQTIQYSNFSILTNQEISNTYPQAQNYRTTNMSLQPTASTIMNTNQSPSTTQAVSTNTPSPMDATVSVLRPAHLITTSQQQTNRPPSPMDATSNILHAARLLATQQSRPQPSSNTTSPMNTNTSQQQQIQSQQRSTSSSMNTNTSQQSRQQPRPSSNITSPMNTQSQNTSQQQSSNTTSSTHTTPSTTPRRSETSQNGIRARVRPPPLSSTLQAATSAIASASTLQGRVRLSSTTSSQRVTRPSPPSETLRQRAETPSSSQRVTSVDTRAASIRAETSPQRTETSPPPQRRLQTEAERSQTEPPQGADSEPSQRPEAALPPSLLPQGAEASSLSQRTESETPQRTETRRLHTGPSSPQGTEVSSLSQRTTPQRTETRRLHTGPSSAQGTEASSLSQRTESETPQRTETSLLQRRLHTGPSSPQGTEASSLSQRTTESETLLQRRLHTGPSSPQRRLQGAETSLSTSQPRPPFRRSQESTTQSLDVRPRVNNITSSLRNLLQTTPPPLAIYERTPRDTSQSRPSQSRDISQSRDTSQPSRGTSQSRPSQSRDTSHSQPRGTSQSRDTSQPSRGIFQSRDTSHSQPRGTYQPQPRGIPLSQLQSHLRDISQSRDTSQSQPRSISLSQPHDTSQSHHISQPCGISLSQPHDISQPRGTFQPISQIPPPASLQTNTRYISPNDILTSNALPPIRYTHPNETIDSLKEHITTLYSHIAFLQEQLLSAHQTPNDFIDRYDNHQHTTFFTWYYTYQYLYNELRLNHTVSEGHEVIRKRYLAEKVHHLYNK